MGRGRAESEMVEIQIGPMIDMVFLLLVFFMVSARPVAQETDLGLHLPGTVAQDGPVEFPDEQRIEIDPAGRVSLNDQVLESGDGRRLDALVRVLARFSEACVANGTGALVVLDVRDGARHQRIVDVLNACARAGLTGVTFGDSEGEGEGW